MSFFSEIRRRKIFQVAAAYAVVSWLLIQVVTSIEEPLNLPSWADTLVIVLLAVGFPITLILSWAFNLTAGRLVRDDVAVSDDSPAQRNSSRSVEYVLIGLLGIAVVWLLYRDMGAPVERDEASPALAATLPAPQPDQEILPNSIAVLVCDNLSPDPNDAFFAQSLHQELLTQLGKIKNLSVISRTSVLPYQAARLPLAEMARELRAESIMECSVAYGDGLVAIGAQLINPRTGINMWSNRYHEEFSDVFRIQSDIAMNIANALQAEFSVAEIESIDKRPTESDEAYTLYLLALSVPLGTSKIFLDDAIKLDPEFAVAYAMRAHSYAWDLLGISGTSPDDAAKFEQLARADATRALAIDPTLAGAHAALGVAYYANWHATEAEAAFERAYQLSPDSDLVLEYGRFKRYRGEYDEAIRLQRRAHELDPKNWDLHYQLGLSYLMGGYYEEADSLFRDLSDSDAANPAAHLQIGRVAVHLGNHEEALRELKLAESLWQDIELNAFRVGQLIIAYSEAGSLEDTRRLFGTLQEIAEEHPVGDAVWARAYIAMNNKDRALAHLRAAVTRRVPTDVPTLSELAVNPWSNAMLDEHEFRELLDGLWL